MKVSTALYLIWAAVLTAVLVYNVVTMNARLNRIQEQRQHQ